MQYLVDTGVLLRLFDASDPEHQDIVSVFRLLRSRGDELITTAQNIVEFWNVSTRPATARGGYGQSVEATERRVRFLERLGKVLVPAPAEYAHWRNLVVTHSISGVSVHDARLVAAMQVAGITHSSHSTRVILSGILTLRRSLRRNSSPRSASERLA